MSEIRAQATPARDELAGVIHAEICEESLEDCLDPDWRGKCARAADVLLAAGWSKPRTVNSLEELDALRVGTRGFTPETWEVWWLRRVGREPHWEGSGGMYSRASDLLAEHGPITVLFTPGEAG